MRDPGNEVVYDTDGLFVRSFGEGTLKNAFDITAANDGRVMVVDWLNSCVHIFSEDGVHLNNFKLQVRYSKIAFLFHRESESVVIAGERGFPLHVEVFTKDGDFVRSTQIHEEPILSIQGVTVTTDGRIAVLLAFIGRNTKKNCKVLVI